MAETAAEYKQRVLGYLGKQSPLAALAAAPRKLERAVAKATPARLKRRPAPDKWSIAEIAAHLADTEVVIAYRLRLILGQPGAAIIGFDQDQWATGMDYAKRSLQQSVRQFQAVRAANVSLLKSLRPAQWKHHGVHNERGPETIATIARLTAGHDLNHLQQIDAILHGVR